MRLRVAAALGLLLPGVAAHAEDVAVTVSVRGGPVDVAGVEAVVWHALHQRHGLEALLVPEVDAAPDAMRAAGITTHFAVDVSWQPVVVELGNGQVAVPPAPDVAITERVLAGDGLQEVASWTAAAMPEVVRDERGQLVTLPEVALQDAVWTAVADADPPRWGTRAASLRVPVVVAADDRYREAHGPAWRDHASARVAAASSLLAEAGLRLEVVGYELWEDADEPTDDLAERLGALSSTPWTVPDAELRVGFTQQRARSGQDVEDVGRAFTPGRDVVVADQALPAGHDEAWDVAEEAVIVAHEVLHALGVPHEERPHHVMSARKTSLVWRLAPRTRALARAAAEARLSHWDPTAALLALADVAERWLPGNERAQLAYVVENLSTVPAPGAVAPARASALVNAALGRHYLRLADERPHDADVHRSFALAHARAAIAMSPGLREDLAPALWDASGSASGW